MNHCANLENITLSEKMESIAVSGSSMNDVVRMATLLRDKGDMLLNSSCKLALTIEFLVKLNESFDLIVDNVDTSCFQVINTNNSSIEFLHDLQFLHDFVQKISGLRLWSKKKGVVSCVRLEKFRALQHLDIYGVSVESIEVSCLKDKLKSLICTHCNLHDVKDLLEDDGKCVPENQENLEVNGEHHWLFLEKMFIPYNEVEILGSSLLYVPRLKLLDLSHNSLTDLSALENSAGNLEWLNVSYNRLKTIPVVTNCTKLKVILVNDNHLADITGLNKMLSLQHIDASNNLLKDHNYLASLSTLARLEILKLHGNPISFKRGHRLLTISHLNPISLASGRFQLDGHLLSPIELSHSSVKTSSGSVTSLPNEISDSQLNRFPQCSPQEPSESLVTHPQNVKIDPVVIERPARVRKPPIAEGEESDLSRCTEKQQESAPTPGSTVHLETKKNIELLRKDFGEENWLHGGGGRRVLDVLGLPMKIPLALVHASSSPPPVVEPSLTQVVHSTEDSGEPLCDRAEEVTVVEEGESVAGLGEEEVVAEDEEKQVENSRIWDDKENGAELGIFLVQRGIAGQSVPMDDLTLHVTDRFLLECDVANGSVVSKCTLNNLAAVSHKNNDGNSGLGSCVNLIFRHSFDVVTETLYVMEEEEAKGLLKLLEEILEEKFSASKENANQFTCMKCSAAFTHISPSEKRSNKIGKKEEVLKEDSAETPKCPKCGSAVVVQHFMEEASNVPSIPCVAETLNNEPVSSTDQASKMSEHKNPIALWAESRILKVEEMTASSEASVHGLHLHVLLNVLPDGQGKEFDIQDVLVFQESSGDAFCGHMVISNDSVYILKDMEFEPGERRKSADENSAPILVEWHPTQHCHSVVKVYSGYLIKFGPQPASHLWIFPRHHKLMEEVMDIFCSSLKDHQPLLDEDQRFQENSKLSEITMILPVAAVTSLNCNGATSGFSLSDAQYGVLVLTPAVIFFVNHHEMGSFMSNAEYYPAYKGRIADLVLLDGAPSVFHQLSGVILHFSSEEDDHKCVVWPWGDGVLLELLYSLQKPWEDLFSVPFDTILAQMTGEEC